MAKEVFIKNKNLLLSLNAMCGMFYCMEVKHGQQGNARKIRLKLERCGDRRKMERVRWVDQVSNKEILERVKEKGH